MTEASRRKSTDDLLAKIDDVVSGHDHQESGEYAMVVAEPGDERSLDDYAYDEEEHLARLAAQLDRAHSREPETSVFRSPYQRLPGFWY